MDEQINPLGEIERLIQARTCKVCGDVWSDILPRYWKCRSEKKGGYVSKHWRNWRLCPDCLYKLSATGFGGFDLVSTPVVARTRKLRVRWRVEEHQDINAF